MATYTILNKVIEIRKEQEIEKQLIQKTDNIKLKFVDSEEKSLKPMLDKEIELKQELDTIKSKIEAKKNCIK
jgi:hypothetical protein